MSQVGPEFPWVSRGLTINEVRRMVNELLHFDKPSGAFKVLPHEHDGQMYDMYFDNLSCNYLQEAWEGWDPDDKVRCGHPTFGSSDYCAEMSCWNYYYKRYWDNVQVDWRAM